jgi:hypothetical protein
MDGRTCYDNCHLLAEFYPNHTKVLDLWKGGARRLSELYQLVAAADSGWLYEPEARRDI